MMVALSEGDGSVARDIKITVTERAGRKRASAGRKRERLGGYSRAVRSGEVLAVTVALGLATLPMRRAYPAAMDAVGDALWAAMVFFGLSAMVPAVAVWKRAVAAIGFAFAIEFSQMYHTPGLDRARATTIGHLVLGS